MYSTNIRRTVRGTSTRIRRSGHRTCVGEACFTCRCKPAFTGGLWGNIRPARTFSHILRRVYFSRKGVHRETERRAGYRARARARYWKPSNWYEKLKWFAKSAEIWQPYSSGLVHQILLRERLAIVLCTLSQCRTRALNAPCLYSCVRWARSRGSCDNAHFFQIRDAKTDVMLKIVNSSWAQLDTVIWKKLSRFFFVIKSSVFHL